MESVAKLIEVSKQFGSHRAVDAFSLEVGVGTVHGFIGPNGSGKTTSLRMLLRIIEPDSGVVEVLGARQGRAANDRVAYLPEERGLYPKMAVLRQLEYFGRLRGMRAGAARASAADWLKRLGLWDWRDKKLETLSKGMSQKVQFIAAVLNNPRLLVLDEPFSGLDPVNMEALRHEILRLRAEGTSILFSTHDMHTAEQFCDEITMIYRGRAVLSGTMAAIRERYGEDTLRLRLAGTQGPVNPASWEGVVAARDLGQTWELRWEGDSQRILQAAMAQGRVERFEIVHPTLHDIFVRIAKPEAQTDG